MQFLRTLFWVMVAVVVVIVSQRNWTMVSINLWAGNAIDVKLPLLVGGAFLAGLLPPLLLYRTTRWRLRRRLTQAERSLGEAREIAAESSATPVVVVPPPADAVPLPAAPTVGTTLP